MSELADRVEETIREIRLRQERPVNFFNDDLIKLLRELLSDLEEIRDCDKCDLCEDHH